MNFDSFDYFRDLIPPMQIITTASEIKEKTAALIQHQSIGFVPTMGALHEGHLKLIKQSKANSDITVCSIFVNPAQFNNPVDFEKYPVTIEEDIRLLEAAGCDILFYPPVAEIYPENYVHRTYDICFLDSVWEGLHRPGHFQGVCKIMDRLLFLVHCQHLWMGQKDYQQCLVVKEMLAITKREGIQFHMVETVRNEHGLALSSRNKRLGPLSLQAATSIYTSFRKIKAQYQSESFSNLCSRETAFLLENGFESVEYLAITDRTSLTESDSFSSEKQYIIIAAAWIEGVRLIDNMLL